EADEREDDAEVDDAGERASQGRAPKRSEAPHPPPRRPPEVIGHAQEARASPMTAPDAQQNRPRGRADEGSTPAPRRRVRGRAMIASHGRPGGTAPRLPLAR